MGKLPVDKKPVLGEGILKTSARELSVFVDEKGQTWICDKDAVRSTSAITSADLRGIGQCQIMPFDHGG